MYKYIYIHTYRQSREVSSAYTFIEGTLKGRHIYHDKVPLNDLYMAGTNSEDFAPHEFMTKRFVIFADRAMI